ncbi:hypothetical protein CgunFtcFv8_013757 [Champsocephalus gunnari]|uniref:Uncharacterized protein n=1 Tax=Champsocephalus gunnari TaxID=52237 RepID=A0AAN8HZA7_CHAGU|nr:hypothetical protein CgunFtcFv8_013757 [Champsocephalus gunnari]
MTLSQYAQIQSMPTLQGPCPPCRLLYGHTEPMQHVNACDALTCCEGGPPALLPLSDGPWPLCTLRTGCQTIATQEYVANQKISLDMTVQMMQNVAHLQVANTTDMSVLSTLSAVAPLTGM